MSKRSEITRRKLFKAAAGITTMSLAAPWIVRGALGNELTKIEVRTGYTWSASQYYSSLLIGKEKGFYREVGLDPNFTEGSGSGSSVQLIASNGADLGVFIASGAVIRAVAQGAPVKMVAATLPSNPICVFSKKESALTSAKDLVGKTIGIPPGTEQEQLWPAVLKLNGLKPSDINVVSIAASALPAALKMDRVDGYISYTTSVPLLRANGLEVHPLLLSDLGVVYAPGEGIVASEKTLSERPDMVRAFLAASRKTLNYALEHPEETAEAGLKAFPDKMQKETAMGMLEVMLGLMKGSLSNGDIIELFRMKEENWANTAKLLSEYAGLEKAPPPDAYFTNEFLPKA
jgi:NitT/TauT family transport system substrate-binding protein